MTIGNRRRCVLETDVHSRTQWRVREYNCQESECTGWYKWWSKRNDAVRPNGPTFRTTLLVRVQLSTAHTSSRWWVLLPCVCAYTRMSFVYARVYNGASAYIDGCSRCVAPSHHYVHAFGLCLVSWPLAFRLLTTRVRLLHEWRRNKRVHYVVTYALSKLV